MPPVRLDYSLSIMDAVHLLGVAGLGLWLVFGVQDGIDDNYNDNLRQDTYIARINEQTNSKFEKAAEAQREESDRILQELDSQAEQVEIIRTESLQGRQRLEDNSKKRDERVEDKLDAVMQLLVDRE